jgi:hypothetical protein
MQNVFSTLLGPILVLWLGALVFYVLDRFLEPQDAGAAEAIVLALATGTLFLGRARLGETFRFGRALVDAGWPGGPPYLLMERTSWILALIVMGTATAASLASLGGRVRGRAGRAAALGAMLLLLSAGDWATLALVWVLVDVSLMYALQEGSGQAEEHGEETERHRRVVSVSLGGAALLGLAVVLWQLSGGDLGGAASPPWPVAGLAMLAALLRLLPWPLPSWHDRESAGDSPGRETPLARVVPYMVPTLSGAYLWARLARGDPAAGGGRWLAALSLWAGLALSISALRAWSAREPRQLIDQAAPYGAALILLAAGLGLPAQWQLLVGASSVLSVCALHVGWTQCQYLEIADTRSYWRVAPAGLAMLSLAGLPLTVGFGARAAIYNQIFVQGRWLVLLLTLAGEAGMLGALLRVLLDVECTIDPETDGGGVAPGSQRTPGVGSANAQAWLRNVGYGGGAVLALAIVILGVAPGLLGAQGLLFWVGLPRMHVWAALLLPSAGAIALYRSQETVTTWMDEWWPLVQRVLDVRWIALVVERGARLVGTVMWGASQVIEGTGYMAWVLLFCLVALISLQAR